MRKNWRDEGRGKEKGREWKSRKKLEGERRSQIEIENILDIQVTTLYLPQTVWDVEPRHLSSLFYLFRPSTSLSPSLTLTSSFNMFRMSTMFLCPKDKKSNENNRNHPLHALADREKNPRNMRSTQKDVYITYIHLKNVLFDSISNTKLDALHITKVIRHTVTIHSTKSNRKLELIDIFKSICWLKEQQKIVHRSETVSFSF